MSRHPVFRQAALAVSLHGIIFKHFLIALILLAGILAPARVFAQSPQPSPDEEVLRVNTDLLLFPARVRDKQGQRPNGLKSDDFLISDPDHATSRVYLSAGVDRVALVFALDLSGSLRGLIAEQKEAALSLYEHFAPTSSIAVLHFDEEATIAAPFAHDTSAARAAFDVAAHPNHHTAIFDAAYRAVQMFDELPQVRSERRIVILMSDGLDTASHIKAKAVIDAAREKRVSFYIICIGQYTVRDGRVVQRRPTKGFMELADATGGWSIYNADAGPLQEPKHVAVSRIFEALEQDIRSQYLVGFYLNEKAHDGKQHAVSLSLPRGLEYKLPDTDYASTHKFAVH
jgi:VWFA-related protein